MCLQREKGEVTGWKATLQLCFNDLTSVLGDMTEFWCIFSVLSCYAFISGVSDVSSGASNPVSSKENERGFFFVWAILYLSVMLTGWKHPAARSWPLRPVWLRQRYQQIPEPSDRRRECGRGGDQKVSVLFLFNSAVVFVCRIIFSCPGTKFYLACCSRLDAAA